jgi:hypothetical protein
MTRRVTTKHEIPPLSFQHPRIRSGVESSFFEVLDPGQKIAGVTGLGAFHMKSLRFAGTGLLMRNLMSHLSRPSAIYCDLHLGLRV